MRLADGDLQAMEQALLLMRKLSRNGPEPWETPAQHKESVRRTARALLWTYQEMERRGTFEVYVFDLEEIRKEAGLAPVGKEKAHGQA